jgi:hypothetical protein
MHAGCARTWSPSPSRFFLTSLPQHGPSGDHRHKLAIGTVVGSVTPTPAGRCVPGLPVAAVRHRYRKVQGMLVRDHWRALPIIYCHIFMLYVELGIYVLVHCVQ